MQTETITPRRVKLKFLKGYHTMWKLTTRCNWGLKFLAHPLKHLRGWGNWIAFSKKEPKRLQCFQNREISSLLLKILNICTLFEFTKLSSFEINN